MGFGSYDESEQREPEFDTGATEDQEDDDLRENDHEGTVSFDSGASTEDLLEGLAGIKENDEDEAGDEE